MTLPEGDPRHGNSGYSNHACRCDICTQGSRARIAKARTDNRLWVALYGLPEGRQHGVSAWTYWGCRCDLCRAAVSAKNKARYAAKTAP